ncbi:30S ribosomal protein S9 [Candidatus Roizmanbacteria bacterium RIFCSPHIGHO2_02_FULL_40_9]|uniref:30S ribosomal protein S9 n=2 Tax=Candidatus Roizmaniibacteriota TaxID=1752723 RepID=A0A1F7IL22_9BACT|nr:MAG: 30S ribosomal protein S9 [Candidatus Roizmanbacteria bacterium RIFCSPHIGHO2_02_FULL_40_9]OGK44034.1 MAG: 30S ribosomal protein S9 [Candidatus Roizmanbacteria bacterium RIFCSPLOWO2_01_FULL_38_11]
MAKKEKSYYEGIGRRKSSVARVRLYIADKSKEIKALDSRIKKGDIFVNNHPAKEYFISEFERKTYLLPLTLTSSEDRFAISVLVKGGGKRSQLGAMSLGLARALELIDPTYRTSLKPYGLLTRDARVRERRKSGTGGRARRQKQSPKR